MKYPFNVKSSTTQSAKVTFTTSTKFPEHKGNSSKVVSYFRSKNLSKKHEMASVEVCCF